MDNIKLRVNICKTEKLFVQISFCLSTQKVIKTTDYEELKTFNSNPVISYKYLGFLQSDNTDQNSKKKRFIEPIHEQLCNIIGTKLSSDNIMIALNKVMYTFLTI